ncbi:MAG: VapE family protein [Anaerovoracaceae bacterium]
MQEELYSVDDVKDTLARTETGWIKQTIDNCTIAFQGDPMLRGSIRKNELTGKIDIVKELGWKRKNSSIVDTDIYQIQHYLENNYGLTSEKNINKAMNIIASENGYHPIIQFLENLKWDGQERIDTLMPKYLGAEDNCYTREIMRLLMMASSHRIYEPGCKFEIMVCLVGGQGVGKSSFFRLLACRDDWFSDDLKRLDGDNVYRKLQGHWIIEMAEMIATVNARSIEDIKAFISRQKDNYKILYETHPEDRPRQCVFVGTSNSMDFLTLDRSGNGRFAPILVHPENVEKHILEDEAEAREFILQAWLDATAEEYVCSIMIYREALHHDTDEPKQWETREINSIMNESITGWKAIKSTHRLGGDYGIQRGWKREADTNGFMKISGDTELPIDKYGRLRKAYLQEHRSMVYSNMVLSDKLWHHLADVEEQAQQRMDVMIQQMKEVEGVTEEMKAKEQMEWVRRMNGIYNQAEEIVLKEIVYI